MNSKILIIHLLALLVCACLPMTPIMSDAANTLALGYIADLNNGFCRC